MEIKAIIGAKFGALGINRKTSTNPFEHNSFKGTSFTGSVLPFADVFQAIKPVEQKPSKLKMVSSAVVGAVNNFKTSLTQPIVKFANNVKETFHNGLEAMKATKNTISEMGRNMHDKISGMFHTNNIAEDMNMPKILSKRHINNNASVQDLKTTWLAENAKISLEKALESDKVVA
jgi:hypothetical protein